MVSIDDPVDETKIRSMSNENHFPRESERKSNASLNVSTTLEFKGRSTKEQSTIYGLVTLKGPSTNDSCEISHIPIDLICVVDQSTSMRGQKTVLLKQSLFYIIDQLNEFDRLAMISFDKQSLNLSQGLKRMYSSK